MSDDDGDVFDVAAERERSMKSKEKIWKGKRKAADADLQKAFADALADPDACSSNGKLSQIEEMIKKRKLITSRSQASELRQRAIKVFGTEEQFNLIYADPPWEHDSDTHQCAPTYQTMSTKDLAALPVAGLAADDSVLVMWATFNMLDAALSIMAAWGFEYKTIFIVWVKVDRCGNPIYRMKSGYTKPCAEFALLGLRGEMMVKERAEIINSILRARPRGHSRKPSIVRDMIPRLFGDYPRIELFGRAKAADWFVWGNQTSAFSNDWTPKQDDDVEGLFLPRLIDRKKQRNDRVARASRGDGFACSMSARSVGTSFGSLHYEFDADDTLTPEERMPNDDHEHDGTRPCCRPACEVVPDDQLRNMTRISAYFTDKGSYAAVRNSLYTRLSEAYVRHRSDWVRRQQQRNADEFYAIKHNKKGKPVRLTAHNPETPTLDESDDTK